MTLESFNLVKVIAAVLLHDQLDTTWFFLYKMLFGLLCTLEMILSLGGLQLTIVVLCFRVNFTIVTFFTDLPY